MIGQGSKARDKRVQLDFALTRQFLKLIDLLLVFSRVWCIIVDLYLNDLVLENAIVGQHLDGVLLNKVGTLVLELG